jgi:long-subunit fatty acid transport protein
MARNNFVASPLVAVAVAAATTKTILAVKAPANIGVAVKSAVLSFDSNNAGQQAIIVEIVRFTSDGTGTTVTATKKNTGTDTIQTVVKHSYTVEPTGGTVVMGFHINPAAGMQYPFPINEEVLAKGGELIGIRVTTPAGVAVNAYPNLEGEE